MVKHLRKQFSWANRLVVDWGARYKGYNSDITRVFA